MGLTNIQRIKLRTELAKLYPKEESGRTVAKDVGIPTYNSISYDNSPKQNWDAIINETIKQGMELDLIEIVLIEYPVNDVLLQLKSELSSGNGGSNSSSSGNSTNANVNTQNNQEKMLDQQIAFLKGYIANGKFDDVFKKLLTISASVSSSYNNSVIIISGDYNRLKQEKRNGTISATDIQLRENRIRFRLLSTIDELKSEVRFNNNTAQFNKNLDEEISTDTIKESLESKKIHLAQTDIELERVIGDRPNFVKKSWLLDGLAASDKVGRIFLKRKGKYEGTGFLVNGGYLLTNEHVIRSKADLVGSFIEFNFTDVDDDENIYRFNFDEEFYHSSPYKSGGIPTVGAYDYALVKVLDNGKIPLADLGHVAFETQIEPIKNDPVNIIQHPGGEVQQFALTANEVITSWDHYLYYKADTEGGSSGSPVFNQDWKVVALHHAGQNEYDASGGLQIDSAGTNKPANRGILIKHIIKDLKDNKGIEI